MDCRRTLIAMASAFCLLWLTGCQTVPGIHWREQLAYWGGDPTYRTVVTPAMRMERLQELGERAASLPPAEQQQLAGELAAKIPKEHDVLLKAQMLRTLAAFPTPIAASAIKQASLDNSRDVRLACCDAWSLHGGPEAQAELSRLLRTDSDHDVRLAAARCLAELKDPAAVEVLALGLEDPDPAMQYRSMTAIREITGRDFGDDVNAYREFARGGSPPEASFATRAMRWF